MVELLKSARFEKHLNNNDTSAWTLNDAVGVIRDDADDGDGDGDGGAGDDDADVGDGGAGAGGDDGDDDGDDDGEESHRFLSECWGWRWQ